MATAIAMHNQQMCRLCNNQAHVMIWARLGADTSEHGWVCNLCYNILWNPEV